MSYLNAEVLAELRQRLHDFMLGFARVDATRMAWLDRPNWSVAAQLELLRRHPLVQMLDDELLTAISARALVPSIEARYLATRLGEVEEESRAELAAAAAHAGATASRQATLPATAIPFMEATVALIARRQLGFEVLHARHADRLDFRDCSVWSIRAALVEAYEEGWHAAP